MAKTIIQLSNGIRIKHLKKPNKYYAFYGSSQCTVDGNYHDGFESLDDAIIFWNRTNGFFHERKSK